MSMLPSLSLLSATFFLSLIFQFTPCSAEPYYKITLPQFCNTENVRESARSLISLNGDANAHIEKINCIIGSFPQKKWIIWAYGSHEGVRDLLFLFDPKTQTVTNKTTPTSDSGGAEVNIEQFAAIDFDKMELMKSIVNFLILTDGSTIKWISIFDSQLKRLLSVVIDDNDLGSKPPERAYNYLADTGLKADPNGKFTLTITPKKRGMKSYDCRTFLSKFDDCYAVNRKTEFIMTKGKFLQR